jgi:hypothetical protein
MRSSTFPYQTQSKSTVAFRIVAILNTKNYATSMQSLAWIQEKSAKSDIAVELVLESLTSRGPTVTELRSLDVFTIFSKLSQRLSNDLNEPLFLKYISHVEVWDNVSKQHIVECS